MLPVLCVSSSRCCGFVWSLPSWYFLAILTLWLLYFPLNKNKRVKLKNKGVLCHHFLHVTKSGFLEARSLIVDITYLSVDLLISVFYIFITFCIRETPKRVLIQTVKAKMKCKLHFIRLYTACKDTRKTIVGKIHFVFLFLFEKLQPDTLDMYNGLSQVHCFKPEGRIHQYTKDWISPGSITSL